MGKPPEYMTGYLKTNQLNNEGLMARLLYKVAPEAQDGRVALNTPRQARRQLFSKNVKNKPLKRLYDHQYHNNRRRNARNFVK